MSEVEARKPGRPPLKKGKASWQPASILDVTNKEPGYRYRWVNKSPENLAKKQAEGWETVSGVNSSDTKNIGDDRLHTGKAMTSVQEKHDCLLMRIDEETAAERDAYFNSENQRRVSGLTAHIKRSMNEKAGGAQVHGSITATSRRGTQVIE